MRDLGLSASTVRSAPAAVKTVRNRFSWIYFALAVVVVFGALFIGVAVHDRDGAAHAENSVWRPGQIAAVEVLTSVVDQETGVRGFVITGKDSFLVPYTEGRERGARALAALRSLFADRPDIGTLVDLVAVDLAAWQIQRAEPEIVAARVDLASARKLVDGSGGTTLFDRLRGSLAELSATIDRHWAESKHQNTRAFTIVLVTATISATILVLMAVFLLNQARRWLTQARTIEDRLRSTIGTIQSSLLPTALPELDHVGLAVTYRPASPDADVGGDFYDLNVSPAGIVTISIGDVCGHDIHAAVVTGLVRHTINAASQHLVDPADVLRWANQALNSNDTDGRFVSAAHAHLHPVDVGGRARLDVALAGHPYPVVIPADGGAPYEVGTAGTLLGVTRNPMITTARILMEAGDQLVLYTDGLTENSQPRLSTEDLLALVGRCRGATASATESSLMTAYDELDRRDQHDDIAIVVLQLLGVAESVKRADPTDFGSDGHHDEQRAPV